MKKAGFIIFFITISNFAFSQALEVGVGSGFTVYKGDLNPNYNPLLARPAAHLMVRYNFSRAFSVKATGMYGLITGKDALSSNPLNKERDWSFNAQIMDWGADLEYNFLNFRASGTTIKSLWTPILFLGFEQYRMPKRQFHSNGLVVESGVDSPDKALSYGFGFKKELNSNWNLSGSFGCKLPLGKSTKDYFDGFGYFDDEAEPYKNAYPDVIAEPIKYSTPNTHTRDIFFYTSFTLSYVFDGVRCPNPRR